MRLHEITETNEIPKPMINTAKNPASPKPSKPRTAGKEPAEARHAKTDSKPKKAIKPDGPQPPKPRPDRLLPYQAYLLP